MENFLKSATSFIQESVSVGVDLVYNKSELEKKLDEALSKANWGASTTLLKEIAGATRDR